MLPYTQVQALGAGGLELVPTTGIVEALRAVKDEDEIGMIRRAARAAERAFEALTAETWIGRSERELAWRLRTLMHAHGVDHLAFDTAIAAGPNGSKPHGEPERHDRRDADARRRSTGAPGSTATAPTARARSRPAQLPAELREIYDVCLEAQLAAVDGIRPGMTGVEADADRPRRDRRRPATARTSATASATASAWRSTRRRASRPSRSDTLEVGNVITIEPGIYLPGVGGVRIEDLAVVREDGVELLTSFPKELTLVG